MCDERLYYFDIATYTYSRQQKVNVPYLCNAITVKNTGNIICVVDEDPIQPGASKSMGGNRGEILTGRHDISFTTAGMAVIPPTQNPSAVVTAKFYVTAPIGSPKTMP